MNPLIVAALVAALAAGSGSWFITSSIKNAEIDQLKTEHMKQERDDAEASLKQFKEAAEVVNLAASKAQVDLKGVNAKLETIRKGNTNAKPLPADCVPDAGRVQSLADSVDAVNGAVSGR